MTTKKFEVRKKTLNARLNHRATKDKIIETIEEVPGTFEELASRVGVARSTFSICASELDREGRIERRIEPPKERGRGKRHRVIIQLSEKELGSVARTLKHLEKITATPRIDVEKGKEILTDDVIDAILVCSSLSARKPSKTPRLPGCPHPPMFECYRERVEDRKKRFPDIEERMRKAGFNPSKFELNEHKLLTALARFNTELGYIESLNYGLDISPFGFGLARFPQLWHLQKNKRLNNLLKRRVENPEMFPIHGVERKTNTIKQFEALLDWIRPLIEGLEFVEARESYHEDRVKFCGGRDLGKLPGFEMKSISWCTTNLAAHVFGEEENKHREMLFRLWDREFSPPEVKKRWKELDEKLEEIQRKASKRLEIEFNYNAPQSRGGGKGPKGGGER